MHLRHITLNSSYVRSSDRAEISDADLAACVRLLDAVDAAGAAPIEGTELVLHTDGGAACCRRLSIWRDNTLLVALGIAIRSACGATLWKRMHDARVPLATDPESCPPEPWVAVRLEHGATQLAPDMLMLLEDYCRRLGWAAIAMGDLQRGSCDASCA